MNDSLLAPAVSFLLTAAMIVVLRPLALRIGLTDKPNQRKQHAGEVPLVGGIAVYTGAAATLIAGILLDRPVAPTDILLAWLLASLLLVAVGVIDDLRGLSPLVRLSAEIPAVLIMALGGQALLSDLGWITPSETLVSLGGWAIPFTVFAAVGVINAFNMCDGLDGLSGNLALVTLLSFGLADGLWGGGDWLLLTNIMSAAVAGFLLFNQRMLWRNKAMVFLGDAGSTLLGFTLAWGAIDLSQGMERALSPAATLWFLMVPVFDTVRVMIRRLLRGQSPFAADAYHLHHLLIRAGFRVSEAIAIICLAAACGAGIGFAGRAFHVPEFWLAAGYTVMAAIYYVVIERAWRRGVFLGKKLAPLDERGQP